MNRWTTVKDRTMKTARMLQIATIQAVVLTTIAVSAGAQEGMRKAGTAEDLRGSRPDPAMSGTNLQNLRSIPIGAPPASVDARTSNRDKTANRPNPGSTLHGRIIFHRYTNYDAWDGRLYLYDFGTRQLKCLSERWEIDHAINANFSPDGQQIVFMGVPRGQHRGDAWNVYLWRVGSRAKPLNITGQPGTRARTPGSHRTANESFSSRMAKSGSWTSPIGGSSLSHWRSEGRAVHADVHRGSETHHLCRGSTLGDGSLYDRS